MSRSKRLSFVGRANATMFDQSSLFFFQMHAECWGTIEKPFFERIQGSTRRNRKKWEFDLFSQDQSWSFLRASLFVITLSGLIVRRRYLKFVFIQLHFAYLQLISAVLTQLESSLNWVSCFSTLPLTVMLSLMYYKTTQQALCLVVISVSWTVRWKKVVALQRPLFFSDMPVCTWKQLFSMLTFKKNLSECWDDPRKELHFLDGNNLGCLRLQLKCIAFSISLIRTTTLVKPIKMGLWCAKLTIEAYHGWLTLLYEVSSCILLRLVLFHATLMTLDLLCIAWDFLK